MEILETAQRRIIGIFGYPGSGKSTLAKTLVQEINAHFEKQQAAYLPMDGFHLSNSILIEQGKRSKKGAPDTFDIEGYLSMLQRAIHKKDTMLYAPDYSRDLHEPIAASIQIPPTVSLVITEGNYLALDKPLWSKVREILSELWYLESSEKMIKERLIQRQLNSGKNKTEAESWYNNVDRKNIEIISQTRTNATKIISMNE